MSVADAGLLPADLGELPAIHVEGAELDFVELVLGGLLLHREVTVSVPAGLELAPGSRVALQDAEGVPIALLTVSSVTENLLASGSVSPLRPLTHGPFRRSRLAPAQVKGRLDGRVPYVVTTSHPLTGNEIMEIRADAGDQPIVLLALIGADRKPQPTAIGLVKALRASLGELTAGSLVVPVPLPLAGDADLVANAFGGSSFQHFSASAETIPDAGSAASAGLVVLFSGLSGSGKSTVASAVYDALIDSTDRTITLLDGDVVRRNLSKGLGFSRDDRDANVRRIGYVAAEIARHGGVVICAPIAPYTQTRAAVRAMVTDAGGVFVLIHIATPLAVCEARDRKGLYALARAGKIPEFTGISDPYEEPIDADLRLDTSELSVDQAVDAVLALLRDRGLAPTANRKDY